TAMGHWYKSPVKSFTVSSLAIAPIAMVLDPDADVESQVPAGENDWLYVAAGRDGLWMVQADPRSTTTNLAVRIDDSFSGNHLEQDNRRWASALDFATVGETEYLLVLFAAKDDSYLRLYELDQLRSVAQGAVSAQPPI